ncbi:MAG: D-glycero-beta-D-manno-heptose-7-phosphate kinase [Bacteroidetes bacterium]|nr:D-glycero-beta-D-manno-heptose-7-phosphate kinase [Bacteroidota bacterium]
MIDSYVWGKVNRLSPEAPVPIVAVEKKENRLGGAANVALNIQALGANPILCCVTGNDYYGKVFTDLLKKQKLVHKGVVVSNARITTVKTRIIGNNHQLVRVDEELNDRLSKADAKKVVDKVTSLFSEAKIDAVVFEDYNKGLLFPELISDITKLANKKNIPIIVDPKRANFNDYAKSTLFKPNLKELCEGAKIEIEIINEKELNVITDAFRKKHSIDSIMVTLSEHGVYVNDGTYKKIIPAHKRSIADVSGAGDTVVSVAALCTALKLPIEFTASLANLAGGLVCEHVGVIPVNKKQLLLEAEAILTKSIK